MPNVEVYRVGPDGAVRYHQDVKGGLAYGLITWRTLGNTYRLMAGGFSPSHFRPLWEAFASGRLSRGHDLVLGTTLDRGWCRRELVPELVDSLRAFHAFAFAGWGAGGPMLGVAEVLEQLLAIHPDTRGVAFNINSGVPDYWTLPTDDGEGRPLNLDTDKGRQWEGEWTTPWEMGAELDKRTSGLSGRGTP